MEDIRTDSRSDIVFEKLSRITPILNEDLTSSVLSRIESKNRTKRYKFIDFIRIYSSAAAVFIIIVFLFTKKPTEEKHISNQQQTKIQITNITKESYLSNLQKNTDKNRLNIQKKKQLKKQ